MTGSILRSTSSAAFTRLPLAPPIGTNVVSNSAFSSRALNEPRDEWWRAMLERLDELCKLPTGWNGYSAPPVSFLNANFAASMLASACPGNTARPQIVPGPNGDLQVEWHTHSSDIELHVRGPYDVQAWRLATSTGEDGEEVHLTADFKIVADWLAELSETSIAARSAAA